VLSHRAVCLSASSFGNGEVPRRQYLGFVIDPVSDFMVDKGAYARRLGTRRPAPMRTAAVTPVSSPSTCPLSTVWISSSSLLVLNVTGNSRTTTAPSSCLPFP